MDRIGGANPYFFLQFYEKVYQNKGELMSCPYLYEFSPNDIIY